MAGKSSLSGLVDPLKDAADPIVTAEGDELLLVASSHEPQSW